MGGERKQWLGLTTEHGLLALVLLGLGGLYCYLMRPHIAGLWYDDGLYLLGAKALATGHGYRLLSEPGWPGIVKYPPLLSLILTPLWWLNPHFPDNLAAMKSLNMLVGLGGLTLAHQLARRYFGLGTGAALLLLLLLGLQPTWIGLIRDILSEPLYLLLTMLLMVLTSRIHQQERPPKRWEWVGCIALSVAAFYTRTIGITAVLGVGLWLWRQWGFKLAGRYLTLSLLLCSFWLAWTMGQHAVIAQAGHFYTASYNQTYLNEMMLEVMKQQGLQHVLWYNFVLLPAAVLYTLFPLCQRFLEGSPGLPFISGALWATLLFILNRTWRRPWAPVWTYSLCYGLACLLWHAHEHYVRFLLLISPLLWMGLFRLFRETIQPRLGSVRRQWMVQGLLCLVLLACLEPQQLQNAPRGEMMANNAGPALLQDYQATFAAIRQFSTPQTRYWARYCSLYPLYTGQLFLGRNIIPVPTAYRTDAFQPGAAGIWAMIAPIFNHEKITHVIVEPRMTVSNVIEAQDATTAAIIQSAPQHFEKVYTSPHGIITIYHYRP